MKGTGSSYREGDKQSPSLFPCNMTSASELKANIDILTLIGRDTVLEKVAKTGGGEWAGACPFCGGEDRFRVQEQAPPEKKPQGQRWMCRQCSPNWGDVIGYVMKSDNLEFLEALAQLSGDINTNQQKILIPEEEQMDWQKWVGTASEFTEECCCHLWSDEGQGALNWLHKRSLEDTTLQQWFVGYNPREGYGKPEEWGLAEDEKVWLPRGIVIPCQDAAGLHYLKIRRRVGEHKYVIVKGGEQWPFGLQTYRGVTTAFLFEGELDVLLAHQTRFTGVGYASIPAGQHIKKCYQPFFGSIIDVIVAYDSDDPGRTAARKLCRMRHFHKAEPYPMGKDLTEYHQAGGDVFEWLYQQVGLLSGEA